MQPLKVLFIARGQQQSILIATGFFSSFLLLKKAWFPCLYPLYFLVDVNPCFISSSHSENMHA
jgi:hypothetical protein